MKTARFLFAIAGFGALTLGLSFASEPSRQPSGQGPSEHHTASDPPADRARGSPARSNGDQPDGKRSKSKDDSHASEQSSHPGPTSKAMPRNHPGGDHPKQVAISHEDARNQRVDNTHTQQRTPANDLHQPGLSKAATAAKAGLMLNTPGNHWEQPVRLPMGGGTIAPLPGVVRGRGAAPAIIGGLAASSAKSSAAAINGAGIKPKP